MRLAPLPQNREDRPERTAVRGDAVANAQLPRRKVFAEDQIVRHHLPKLFAQHFRRHARHRAPQRAEPQWLLREPLEDHRLPASVDDGDRRVKRTARSLLIYIRRSPHLRPPRAGYFKVPSCRVPARRLQWRHGGHVAATRIFRVIMPVWDLDAAVRFYQALLDDAGMR